MIVAPFWRRRALSAAPSLFLADFTALASGAASTLFGLSHTRGSSATVQTGTSTVYSSLGVDVAGIGRALDADALGVVIEEARTNAHVRSGTLSTGWTALNVGTPSASATLAPDGSSLYTVTDTNDTGVAQSHAVYQAASPGSGTTTYSMVLKAGSLSWVALFGNTGIVTSAYLNLGTGALGTLTGAPTARVASIGGGLYWAELTFAASATLAGVYLASGNGGQSYAGVGTGTILAGMAQSEQGKFRTEYIPTTTASLARSGARLWHPSGLVSAGRLELRLVLQTKGATADYASAPYLWRVDASNYATISNVDGKVTIVINGASYTTASGITWAQGDVLDVRVMAGGGSLNSIVKIGKNGGALSTLGTSGAAQGTIPTGALDLMQDGSAGNVFSSRLRSAAAYAPGVLAAMS